MSKVLSGVSFKYGEEWVRCMFREYTQFMVAVALDEVQLPKPKREEAGPVERDPNDCRFAELKKTPVFHYLEKVRAHLSISSPLKENYNAVRILVRNLHVGCFPSFSSSHARSHRFMQSKKMTNTESLRMLLQFDQWVKTRDEIKEVSRVSPRANAVETSRLVLAVPGS